METDHKIFYNSYLKEYHEVRAIYLRSLLSDTDKINEIIKENEFEIEETSISLTENTKFIIQADLRQNYFHALETFFEFLFAFLPKNTKIPDNRKILRAIVKSNWSQNYKKIAHIANGNFKLNFLNETINILDHEVSIGQYLFYLGTFSSEKFDNEYQVSVSKSIESIKKIIKILAVDFAKRDEYNAYKHTMRIFPTFKSVHILNANTLKEEMNFDLSNSASYQVYNDKENETAVKTKLFDPERDFKMTKLCSRLIYNMIQLRSVVFGDRKEKKPNTKLAIYLFENENIQDITKHNVEIQDLIFSSKLLKSSI